MTFFFFNDTATTEIYTLSLHDALPIYPGRDDAPDVRAGAALRRPGAGRERLRRRGAHVSEGGSRGGGAAARRRAGDRARHPRGERPGDASPGGAFTTGVEIGRAHV